MFWSHFTPENHCHNIQPREAALWYHFDQRNAVEILKCYSLASIHDSSGPAHEAYQSQIRRLRFQDTECFDHNEMRCHLLKMMETLNEYFFLAMFTTPVLTQDETTANLVSIDVRMEYNDQKYGMFDEVANRITLYVQDARGRNFNGDRLLYALAHEMMHAFIHLFGFELDPHVRECMRREAHSGAFWAGLEFVYWRLWQMAPDSNILTHSAFRTRQRRWDTEGDTPMARNGLGLAFFLGYECVVNTPVTLDTCEAWDVAKLVETDEIPGQISNKMPDELPNEVPEEVLQGILNDMPDDNVGARSRRATM
ncbi:hypothetical protein TruAng_011455 [Truncatella angustata]|nr:hypothetical protein TruAng_011455 [Truncatella angustata]